MLFSVMSFYANSFDVFKVWTTALNELRTKHDLSPIKLPPTNEYKGQKILTFPYQLIDLYTPTPVEVEKEFSSKLERILRHYKESLARRSDKSTILVRAVHENTVHLECRGEKWCLRIHSQHQLRFFQLFVSEHNKLANCENPLVQILATLFQQYNIEIVSAKGTPQSLYEISGGLTSIFKSFRLGENSEIEGDEEVVKQFWNLMEKFNLAFDILKGVVLFDEQN